MTGEKSFSPIKELDVVCIPNDLADREGVERQGTVVWYVEGAPYVTVECAVLGGVGIGDKTKLLDIDLDLVRRAL